MTEIDSSQPEQICRRIRREMLIVHRQAPGTRIASSLSAVEVLVSLFYANLLSFRPEEPLWKHRDRLIISKAHGGIALYPILADLGFFPRSELETVGRNGSRLGTIPDPIIPGFETLNGSLGHGPGVANGIALALRSQALPYSVVVLCGDGELYEGAVWEAVMFAAHHQLDNITLIVDANEHCMLGDCISILNINPIADKLAAFGWDVSEVAGHDTGRLVPAFRDTLRRRNRAPKAVIAHTVKGKGVPELETDPLSHVKSIAPERINELVKQLS